MSVQARPANRHGDGHECLHPTAARVGSLPGSSRQIDAARGQAVIAALLLLTLIAAGGLLAGGELRARAHALAHARSVEALATARAALIGYAISYAETHPGEGYGFLPCPDSGQHRLHADRCLRGTRHGRGGPPALAHPGPARTARRLGASASGTPSPAALSTTPSRRPSTGTARASSACSTPPAANCRSQPQTAWRSRSCSAPARRAPARPVRPPGTPAARAAPRRRRISPHYLDPGHVRTG
jgi:hypothetical protein